MSTLKQVFTNIANAIREKTTKTNLITPEDMATEIYNYSWVKNYIQVNGSAEHLFCKFAGTECDKLLHFNDLIDTTSCREMFMDAKNIITIPLINTSNIRNMGSMFYNCFHLITIPDFNTNKVTNMYGMFNSCRSLSSVPLLDTSIVLNMSGMFSGCHALTVIPEFDCNRVNDFYNFVSNCSNIEEINLININADLDIHWSTKMQQSALHKVIDNLMQQHGTTKILTMGATLLARVSDEYKQKAKAKGWTLA